MTKAEEMKRDRESAPGMHDSMYQKGHFNAMWEIYTTYCDTKNIYKTKRGEPEELFHRVRSVGEQG